MQFYQFGGAVPTSPIELVTHASPVTKLVLVILAVLSLLSWGIMIMKWREFRRVSQASRSLWREFEHITHLAEAQSLVRRAEPNAFIRVLTRALDFLRELRSAGAAEAGARTGPLSGSQVEALRLVLDAETTVERDALGRYVATLAVIGSASPLLGLLGTVLGVIDAFLGIATQGSGNIAAVAPGVAEALIATAVALAVAIPAVFGYNIFANRLNRFENDLDGFGTEIIAMLVREGQI
ncbi:MAG: MotA/TolQ/ExbB proton channel family protein [Gemmatimonadaceae bacterium]